MIGLPMHFIMYIMFEHKVPPATTLYICTGAAAAGALCTVIYFQYIFILLRNHVYKAWQNGILNFKGIFLIQNIQPNYSVNCNIIKLLMIMRFETKHPKIKQNSCHDYVMVKY